MKPIPALSRRAFTKSMGALGLGALAGAYRFGMASEDGPKNGDRLIDTHHHFLPPEYVRIVGREAIGKSAPTGAPDWDIAQSLRVMDANGIAGALVSISAPGIWFGNAAKARHLARICNEYAAQMSADHPARFGFFAALPLPDVAGSLAEVGHAVEELHCDGIGLITNYGDHYLGDPHFDAVFDEINRRKLTVYVHPNVCNCDQAILPGIPSSMIEFPHSTTRAIIGLLSSGTFTRCPDIQFIFSHAGGTLPFLVNRVMGQANLMHRKGWDEPLRRCYYDTAGSANSAAFGPLLQLVTSKQVLFGSDFPFAGEPAVSGSIAGLRGLNLPVGDLADIEGANAKRLFKRFS
jgi:predicted TIM-barrel fold metal-dependent hydrolase